VTDKKPQVPLADNYAVTMFCARALDLLAQSESQHRVVIEAHTRLAWSIAEWRINPPTPVEREDRLSMIADVVCEVIAGSRTASARYRYADGARRGEG
jgi:hypothetical protein